MIAKGTDVPAKEEGKVVWMWKDESSISMTSLAMADAAMEEDTVKPTAAAKSVHKVRVEDIEMLSHVRLECGKRRESCSLTNHSSRNIPYLV